MNVKWKYILIALSIFCILSLVGCSPKVKEEKELSQDLLSSEAFDALLWEDPEKALPFSITNFTIRKRQTDSKNKSDVVYADFDLGMLDGSASGSGSCVMSYGLYNEGWILDKAILEGPLQLSPLRSPDITEEELFSIVRQFHPKGELSEFSVSGPHENLENKTATYAIAAKIAHKYMDEYLDMICFYIFDEQGLGGWQLDSCMTSRIREDWLRIQGIYESEPDANNNVVNVDIVSGVFMGDFEKEFIPANISWLAGRNGEYFVEGQSRPVIDVRDMSSTELFYNLHLTGVVSRECIEKGYSVVVDDENWEDIIYVAKRSDYFWPLFIGKDAIFAGWDDSHDDLHKIVHMSCPQVFPIT